MHTPYCEFLRYFHIFPSTLVITVFFPENLGNSKLFTNRLKIKKSAFGSAGTIVVTCLALIVGLVGPARADGKTVRRMWDHTQIQNQQFSAGGSTVALSDNTGGVVVWHKTADRSIMRGEVKTNGYQWGGVSGPNQRGNLAGLVDKNGTHQVFSGTTEGSATGIARYTQAAPSPEIIDAGQSTGDSLAATGHPDGTLIVANLGIGTAGGRTLRVGTLGNGAPAWKFDSIATDPHPNSKVSVSTFGAQVQVYFHSASGLVHMWSDDSKCTSWSREVKATDAASPSSSIATFEYSGQAHLLYVGQPGAKGHALQHRFYDPSSGAWHAETLSDDVQLGSDIVVSATASASGSGSASASASASASTGELYIAFGRAGNVVLRSYSQAMGWQRDELARGYAAHEGLAMGIGTRAGLNIFHRGNPATSVAGALLDLRQARAVTSYGFTYPAGGVARYNEAITDFRKSAEGNNVAREWWLKNKEALLDRYQALATQHYDTHIAGSEVRIYKPSVVAPHQILGQQLANIGSYGNSFGRINYSPAGAAYPETNNHAEVDFANRLIGGGVLTKGNVQEEFKLLASNFLPWVAAVRGRPHEGTSFAKDVSLKRLDTDPVVIKMGFPFQMVHQDEIYGSKLKLVNGFNPSRYLIPSNRPVNLYQIAMAAVDYSASTSLAPIKYSRQEVEQMTLTATKGFYEAMLAQHSDGVPIEIHTGKWGAGAFNNSPLAIWAMQRLAIEAAYNLFQQTTGISPNVNFYYDAYDAAGVAEAQAAHYAVSQAFQPTQTVSQHIDTILQWAAVDPAWQVSAPAPRPGRTSAAATG